MNELVPKKIFLTKGVGRHKYQLKSFEEALRNAGVAQQNLVQVSSILPPKCKIVSRETGLAQLVPGSISFSVMARADTNEHGRMVASSVGVGVLSEISVSVSGWVGDSPSSPPHADNISNRIKARSLTTGS